MVNILNIFTDLETLLLVIPIVMIVIAAVILLVSYMPPIFRRKPAPVVEVKKNVKPDERIDFPIEVKKVLSITNSDAAVRKLSLLINRFFSQLFGINRAFTYDEIKRLAKTYGFNEMLELCDMLSNLNFAKNTYSGSDLEVLGNAFEKVLDSYGYIVTDRWKEADKKNSFSLRQLFGLKASHSSQAKKPSPVKLSASKTTLEGIWLKSSSVSASKQSQLERYLLLKHPHLFGSEIKSYSSIVNIGDKLAKISKLVKLGQDFVKKGDALSSSEVYNSVVMLYNSLVPKDRKTLWNVVNEFYINVLNIAALKASYELIDNILNAINSGNQNLAKQLFHELEYIYVRLPLESSTRLYNHWLESTQEKV